MEIILKNLEFQDFISKCTVSYEGDSYGSNGKMKDPEGNEFICTINYDKDDVDFLNEVWVDDEKYFIPTDEQQSYILKEIDKQTYSERENNSELRSEPSSKYELYGVSPQDFF